MNGRLVWMTLAQRDLLVNPQVPGDREAVVREIVDAWDAALPDPLGAAKYALSEQANGTADLLARVDLGDGEHYDADEFDDEAWAVLRAIGVPEESA